MPRTTSPSGMRLDRPSEIEGRLHALDAARVELARMIESIGVRTVELLVLRSLGGAPQRRWEELLASTSLDEAALSDALDGLLSRALVSVRPCAESAEFVLTPRGAIALRRAHRRLEDLSRRRSDA